MVEGAPDRFSVNGNDLSVKTGFRLRFGPRSEARLEGLCVDQTEDPTERVVRGNPMLQIQKLGEPVRIALPVENDILVALGSSDCRADGDYQDIGERIKDFSAFPRVIEIRKAVYENIHRPKQAEQEKNKPLGLSWDIRPGSLHINLMR
nr:hypothetical protein [Salinibacter altiplanensis]